MSRPTPIIPSEIWRNITFKISDLLLPNLEFQDRLRIMTNLPPPITKNYGYVRYDLCSGQDHLQSFYKSVKEKRGKGVILYNSEGVYIPRGNKVNVMCKLKVSLRWHRTSQKFRRNF